MHRIVRYFLNQSELLRIIYDWTRQSYLKYMVSDEHLIRKKFRKHMGREVELENPQAYNDKLQWLKLNWYDPIAHKCVDKYEVREIVKNKIGEEYLNSLIALYDSVDKIDIDALPESFVLKATHSSGHNLIVKDKSQINWKKEFKNMRRWLRREYFWFNREWVYKDVKPRIVCEKYIEEIGNGACGVYKIFCFHGEVKFIYVENDKMKTTDFYDTEWNRIPVRQHYPNSKEGVKRPDKLSKCIELCEILSKDFPHVRVDFFISEDSIIFSECTFFNWTGMKSFYPEEYDVKFGEHIDLTKINAKQ